MCDSIQRCSFSSEIRQFCIMDFFEIEYVRNEIGLVPRVWIELEKLGNRKSDNHAPKERV